MAPLNPEHPKGTDQGTRRTIVRRSRQVTGIVCLAGALVGIFIAGFFAQAWINYKVIAVGYQINQLEKENDQLKETYQQLTVELSNLTSSRRIETIAVGKLGLKTPLPEQIIKVK